MITRTLGLTILALACAVPLGARAQGYDDEPSAYAPEPPVSWEQAETQLAREINAYRAAYGLPPVAISPALTAVARAHVRDLAENHPNQGPCGLHSWSPAGRWSPVCYTGDPRQGAAMWSKPREITGGRYRDNGFEIAVGDDRGFIAPETAMRQWRSSPLHNAVILQQGTWINSRWQAMGVGVYRGYAVAWFGNSPDGTTATVAVAKASPRRRPLERRSTAPAGD